MQPQQSNEFVLFVDEAKKEKNKKELRVLLKGARLVQQVQEFEILQIRDGADAKRKLLDLSKLGGNNKKELLETNTTIKFPFLYVRLQPIITPTTCTEESDGVVGEDLCQRLIEFGCIPAELTISNNNNNDNKPTTNCNELTQRPTNKNNKKPFVYDMETSDPDDVLTLLYLLSAPAVDLELVTINPGTRDQVGLVYSILHDFQRHHDVLIGSGVFPHNNKPKKEKKDVVDAWYKTHFRAWTPRDADGSAAILLCKHCHSDTIMVTGGAWTNVARAIDNNNNKGGNFELGALVAQGGFASASVCGDNIPQFEQFQGLEYMSSYNMNANPKAVQKVASYKGISIIKLVSKNICHREIFDRTTLQKFPPNDLLSQGLAEIKRLMTEAYFDEATLETITKADTVDEKEWEVVGQNKTSQSSLSSVESQHQRGANDKRHQKIGGKKIHDIVAAACAIAPEVATWRQVEIIGGSGAWGTRLSSDSRIFVTVDYDPNKFLDVFLRLPSDNSSSS